MMRTKLFALLLSMLLVAAHFLRNGNYLLVAICLALPLLLLIKRRWSLRLVQGALLIAAGVWVQTLSVIARQRIASGRPWGAAAVILLSVAAYTLFTAWLFNKPGVLAQYPAE